MLFYYSINLAGPELIKHVRKVKRNIFTQVMYNFEFTRHVLIQRVRINRIQPL